MINRTIKLSLVLLIAIPAIANAYTDPGSGLLLWQLLGSFVIGLGFYFRQIVSAIKRLFNSHGQR